MTAMPTRRRGNAMMAIIAIIALVVIGAVVYMLMKPGGKKPGGIMETGLKMAPATSQVFVAMDFAPVYDEAKQKELLDAFKQTQVFKTMAGELKSEGLNLEEEILSWVKPSMALALAPLEGKPSIFTDIENSKVPPFTGFLLVGVRDDAKAKESIEKLMGKAKIKFKNEDHKGAKLWIPEKGVEDGPTIALAPGMLIVGIKDTDVKAALDGPSANLAGAANYKAAMSKIRHQDVVVMYGDLQGMIKGAEAALKEIPPEAAELKKLVEGIRYLAAGAGTDGKDLVSEIMVSIDPAASGKLASLIFKPSYGIFIKSAELYPAESEMYGSVNLKMVWQMIYDCMGEFPETAQLRDMPAQQMSMGGIDLQKNILDPLTGELAYSVDGYGKVFSQSLEQVSQGEQPDPADQMEMLQEMPVVLALGLANKAEIEGLINKNIPEPVRATFKKEEHNGVTIYNVEGQFYYAMTEDFMLIGINEASEAMKKMIDAKKSGKNIKSLPGFGRVIGMLGPDKPVYFQYMDIKKVYGEAGNELAKSDPGMAKLLQLAGDYQGTWQAGALRADGFYMVSVTTRN